MTLLWLGALLIMRLVLGLQVGLGLPDALRAIVPLLFIYAPVWLCGWRGVDSWSYRLSIPAFSDRAAWRAALGINLKLAAILLPPFLIGYHLYQTTFFHFAPGRGGHMTLGWVLAGKVALEVAHQLFFVALPEEFFYRGYFQTRLNEVFPRRWMIFGVPMGWGAVLACVYFAFGHSLVLFQWWHFATFFPGLAFAWLRERNNGVVPGAIFHAGCNLVVLALDLYYGIPRQI